MRLLRGLALLAAAAIGLAACDSQDDSTTSMRDTEKRIKDSLPKTQEIALAQNVEPALLAKVQAELKALNEYLDDPPSGKIDMVTVNAIEAFQRRVGVRDDGLLDSETLRRLEDAAAHPTAAASG